MKPIHHHSSPFCRFVLFLLVFILIALAVNAQGQSVVSDSQSAAKKVDLSQSIANALVSEEKSVENLKIELAKLKQMQADLLTELNTYKIQNTTHANLLTADQTSLDALEKAENINQQTLSRVMTTSDDIEKRHNLILEMLKQIEAQISLNQNQMAEAETAAQSEGQKMLLQQGLNRLQTALTQKQQILEEMSAIDLDLITRLGQIWQLLKELDTRFDQEIKVRQKSQLFQRLKASQWLDSREIILQEFQMAISHLKSQLDSTQWTDVLTAQFQQAPIAFIFYAVLALVSWLLLGRAHRYIHALAQRPFGKNNPWRLLVVNLVLRAVMPGGAIIFLFICDSLDFPIGQMRLPTLLIALLLIIIFLRWGCDLIQRWQDHVSDAYFSPIQRHLRKMIRRICFFACLYQLLVWFSHPGAAFLFIPRVIFEMFFLINCVRFRKLTRPPQPAESDSPSAVARGWLTIAVLMGYVTALGGILIEVLGFGVLAMYWYASWARTLSALIFGAIGFKMLREWQQYYRPKEPDSLFPVEDNLKPLRWLAVQITWLAWGGVLVIGLILAWVARKGILISLYEFLQTPIPIGNVSFSLMNVLHVFLTLFFTHALTRLVQYLLKEKILDSRDIDHGLRDSITVITVYVIWAVSLLISLGILGVSATSLAMVFGALSIGIGFGLQNIFNNFISGIILLFERPIQVGDAIEVNGIWGEVKKINVRSTLVQSYDNASLIIPNADIISNQVTNWSFKDARLRRNIDIGVAYGSDVKLVEKILLQIADETPDIYKYPRPNVIFMDHGDSALLFRLRYWTHLDYFYTTSTAIRFGIDKHFREANIEIPFPQRDVHIRSTCNQTAFEKA